MLLGLVVAFGLLAMVEVSLRVWVRLGGADLRTLDPLSRDMDVPVLCGSEEDLVLCPVDDGHGDLLRDRHFAHDKDRPRVIAVGESFVFGLGYEPQDSWPGRLQARLGDGVEVLNFGKCGSESSSLMPVVAAAIDLHPDALLLAIGNNEYAMAPYYGGLFGRHPVLSHDALSALGQLQLYGLLNRGLGGRLPSRAGMALRDFAAHPQQAAFQALHRRPADISGFPRALVDPPATEVLEDSKRLAERLFGERLQTMLRWARSQQVPVVLLTVPRDPLTPPLLSGLHHITRVQAESWLDRLALAGPPRQDPLLSPRSSDYLALARQAVAADPQLASFQWQLGLALWRDGQQEPALSAWEQARQWDLAPDSTPAINVAIRHLADREGVPLVDLDRLKDGWVGTSGTANYRDQVHVSPEGAQAIAVEIDRALSAKGLLR
ncbi:MAG: hypothetical protein GXP62_00040 [Oligoflexia bacterium]|nr:hypothetical protein [Oligoflexia bacterium]